MSSVLQSPPSSRLFAGPTLPWLIVLAGFAAMYGPVYIAAATGIWQTDEQAHGALVLAVVAWLFWRIHRPLIELPAAPAPLRGWLLFAFGLLVYVTGRVFKISILEFASQPFIVAGVMLLIKGTTAIRLAWFPLLYFVFMIPLPGILVDAITGG